MTNNNHSKVIRNILEAIAAAINADSKAVAFINDDMNYGRDRFFLDVTQAGNNPMWSGAPVLIDQDENGNTTLWVRPLNAEQETMPNTSAAALAPVQDRLNLLRAYQAKHGTPNDIPWCKPGFETYVLRAA